MDQENSESFVGRWYPTTRRHSEDYPRLPSSLDTVRPETLGAVGPPQQSDAEVPGGGTLSSGRSWLDQPGACSTRRICGRGRKASETIFETSSEASFGEQVLPGAPTDDFWNDQLHRTSFLSAESSFAYSLPPDVVSPPPPWLIPFMTTFSLPPHVVSQPSLPNVHYVGMKPGRECRFCKNNGMPSSVYKSHALRNPGTNKVICPSLRKMVCDICGATGDNAHTRKYCRDRNKVDQIRKFYGRPGSGGPFFNL